MTDAVNRNRLLFRMTRVRGARTLLRRLESGGYPGTVGRPEIFRDLYVDTQDGRLHKTGSCLRRRQRRGRAVWELIPGEKEIVVFPAPDERIPREGPLAEALQELDVRRELLPLARVRTHRQELRLSGPEGAGFRGCLESWTVQTAEGARSSPSLRLLEIHRTSGAPEELERLAVMVRDLAGLQPIEIRQPLITVLDLLNLPPPGAPIPRSMRATAEDRLVVSIRKILQQQAYKMRANLEGTLRDLDLEFLHDLRVATRRARSALRLMGDCIGPRRSRALQDELRWIGGLLGKVRDWDVFLENLPDQLERCQTSSESASWLRAACKRRRDRAREMLVPALESRRFRLLQSRLERIAGSPPPRAPRGDCGRTVGEVAPRHIRKDWKRVHKRGRIASRNPCEENLHRLRIQFKRLRYTCEFHRYGVPVDLKAYLKLLVHVQDTLGALQDAVVATERFMELVDEAA